MRPGKLGRNVDAGQGDGDLARFPTLAQLT